MRLRHKIGFGIYLLYYLIALATGLNYFFSQKMMPYHAQAIGKNWAELDQGIQAIILALMKMAGDGCITIAFLGLVVLFIPFRRGERWANWTLFLGTIVYGGLGFFVTFRVYLVTHASSPWPLALISMIIGLAGFLFSLGIEKKNNNPYSRLS